MEALSTTDISKQLAATFENLAKLQRRAKELQDEQSQEDIVTFAGTVEEYGRLIGSVRVSRSAPFLSLLIHATCSSFVVSC
jgi:sorting nexin-1/2